MIFDLSAAEEKIGYNFKDKILLRQCFTHSSYSYENKNSENNEVLEFFGDSILGFVVTEYLCKNVTGDEGKLTEVRKKYVSKEPLQEAVYAMGLDKYMLLGNGEIKCGCRNEKLYSSLFEAIVAGIYNDGGLAPAKKFILDKLIVPVSEKIAASEKTRKKSSKNELQEYVQKNKLGDIVYEEISRTGPDHLPVFRQAIRLNGKKLAEGVGGSKKQAEEEAAKTALVKIKKNHGVKK